MLVLDTDALSIIQRGTGPRFLELTRLLDSADDDAFVTIISFDEQVHGAFKEVADARASVRIRGYWRIRDLLNDYCDRPILDYDEDAELIFDQLKGIKGRPATKDLRIASIALANAATLVTANVSDFTRIPELKLMAIRFS